MYVDVYGGKVYNVYMYFHMSAEDKNCTICIRVLHRNRVNRVCVYMRERQREGKIYFKELAYVVVEVVKSKICRMGHHARDPGNW